MSTASLEPPKAATKKEHTPEQLLSMPDGHRYELLDGNLVERNMGAESSEIAANIIRIVGNFVHAHKLGKYFAPDCGYQIFDWQPKRVRFPDGSFIARERLPEKKALRGHIRIAPDLAVEVISRHDNADDMEIKRVEFLRAGTRLLWIVYPEARTVHVHRNAGNPTILTATDELTGEDVLPGFTCRVAELFETN